MTMNELEPDMAEDTKNVEVMLTRIEGKLDRMNDRIERHEGDQQALRVRMHDLTNTVSPLIMLDLPARIRTTDQWRAEHDARILAIENLELQRKGAAGLAKIIWGIAGAVGVGGVAAVLRVFQVGGF